MTIVWIQTAAMLNSSSHKLPAQQRPRANSAILPPLGLHTPPPP